MYYLERACSMQVRALAGGSTQAAVDEGVVAKTAEQGVGLSFVASALLWPALRRRLDREDPSYRD